MKRLAIIGGGITGMSSAIYHSLNNKNISEIHIFTENLGGEFLTGGLKLINNTFYSKFFIKAFLDLSVIIKPIIGAVVTKNIEIEQYPLYMYANIEEGTEIQKVYWNKTRKNSKFNITCMNDPWNKKQSSFKIEPESGIKSVFDVMTQMILHSSKINLFLGKVTPDKVKDIIDEYDHVIYTIPFQMLFDSYGIEYPPLEYNKLSVMRIEIPFHAYEKIWYDFLYTPYYYQTFHRVSKLNIGDKYFLDFEINGNAEIIVDKLIVQALSTINLQDNILSSGDVNVGEIKQMSLKGQIKNSVDIEHQIKTLLPNNVTLLGRYAEWNSRVTWDKVLEKLFTTELKEK